MYRSKYLCLSALALLLLLGAGASAQAQEARPAVLDSLIALVPLRDQALIQAELRRAQDDQVTAAAAIATARALEDRAEARRKLLEGEISEIKRRLDAAKRAKQEADARAAEVDRDAAEAGKKLLEERQALRRAERQTAEAGRELAEARAKALGLELELLQRRLEAGWTTATSAIEAGRARRVVTDLELRTLEARRDEARRARDVANRMLQVVERQMKLHQAQQRLQNPG